MVICEILSVELFLEQKLFLPVLLFDGGQGVDVVLELAHGVLLLLGGSQPPLVTVLISSDCNDLSLKQETD